MFRLTQNEQRVVVLVIVALLSAAFVRYWRDVHSPYAPKRNDNPASTTTPSPSPPNLLQMEEAEEANADEHRPWPSPRSSP